MANLIESETYEPGIYQLEITDPVIGGENGIDNLQAKQLANRTSWLKAAVDLITGTTFYAAMATKLQTARNINGVAFDGTADIEVIGTATNNATANTSFYDTDIFGFFGAASTSWRKITGANIKATLKTYFDQIYANLASPALTGNPTAPIQAASDNSTKIATTGWVVSAMATIAIAAGFLASWTTNGYMRLPQWFGSFAIQWGRGSIPNGGATIAFPVAFTTCFGVVAFPEYSTNPSNTYLSTNGIGLTNFGLITSGGTPQYIYFALGRI